MKVQLIYRKKCITFVRQGLSKTGSSKSIKKSTIFVPALPRQIKLLDPKTCSDILSEKERKSLDVLMGMMRQKLFLSFIRPHRPVSSQTISKWIVNTIKFAYKRQNRSVSNVKGHSTRAVGPSWAIYREASVHSVLNSADWSRETTFTRHYLKSVFVDFLRTN